MKCSISVVMVLASMTGAAWAQDQLLPPALCEGGEFYGTLRTRVAAGQGSLTGVTTDVDFDSQAFQLELAGGLGFGKGFEAEFVLPMQWWADVTGDGTLGGSSIDLEDEDLGFGDVTLSANYRLVERSVVSPQWLVGLILTAPTGNDKRGQPQIDIGGVPVQDLEEGGIGQGVFNYGLGSTVGFDLGGVDAYAAASYVIGGTRKRNGVKEDRADVFNAQVGVVFSLAESAKLDIRFMFNHKSDDETEDSLAKKVEEAHFEVILAAWAYINVGGPATLVLGIGAQSIEDHEVDDVGQLDLEEVWNLFFEVGIHFNLGVLGKKK